MNYYIENKIFNNHLLYREIDPYNPLNLPPYTIRIRCKEGSTVIVNSATAVQISQSPNIWDVTRERSSWSDLLAGHREILEVLGANARGVDMMYDLFNGCTAMTTVPLFDTSSITSMQGMFSDCYSLSSVPSFDTHNVVSLYMAFDDCYSLSSFPLLDTSNVDGMYRTFEGCSSLTSIPLFDTHKVRNMAYTFNNCVNVQTGALALYRQVSTQPNQPNHLHTFNNCGINTQTGSAELAQIPDSWK